MGLESVGVVFMFLLFDLLVFGVRIVSYTQGSTEKLSALLKQTIRTSISSTIHAQVIETRLHDRSYSHLFSVSSLSSD